MKNMKILKGLTILSIGLGMTLAGCKKEGCTDPLASNYDSKANHDDGSCEYTGGGVLPGTTLEVTENITTPTVWSASTIKLCDNITVSAALTIQPGVTVIVCADAGMTVSDGGSINAVGTATSGIVFKGEAATKGYWRGIGIESNNPNNRFEYVTVSDAGSYWFWEFAGVCVYDSGKLVAKNSSFSNSEMFGLWVDQSASIPEFASNTFSNNASAGLNISVKQVGDLDESSNYNAGNGEEFIHTRGGSITANETWKKLNAPLLLMADCSIEAGLTLNPGVNIMFEADAGFDVDESGYLNAVGTAALPITLKGRYSSAGYWDGIYIDSNNPNNKMDYVTLTDGGKYWFYDYATVNVSGRLEMDNCTISNSNSWAVVVQSSSQLLSGGVVQTDAAGVLAYNTMTGNGAGADADCIGGGCTVEFE